MMLPHELFKLLADETRLLASLLLHSQGELCVCELVEALQLSQPKVSRHLALLRSQGLLIAERREQWVYYRIQPELPAWAKSILDHAGLAKNSELKTLLERFNKTQSCG